MCATETAVRNWKRVFFALEAFVASAIVYGITLSITWRYGMNEHPVVMAIYRSLITILVPMLWTFVIVMPFLLVVSPFFLRSLRAAALKAWLFGAVGFMYLLGILFDWWPR